MQHPGSSLHATCDGSETKQDLSDSQTLNAGARYLASTSLLWPWPTNGRLGLSALSLQRPHQVRACCSSGEFADVGGQRSALLLTRELVAPSRCGHKQHSHSLVDRSTLDHTVTPTLSLSASHSLSRPIANQSSGTPISTPDSFQPQP
jgi:hypothetical protein